MAGKARKSDKSTLRIPSLLKEQLEELIEGTDFNSVTEFAVFSLREIVAAHKAADNTEYSPEELERVKGRLKSLGYL